MLFEHKQKPDVSIGDVEEVSNYVKAVKHGLKRLQKDDFPLSLRLLREIHSILLSGSRGENIQPGEFRLSQNWIGGTRPGNALFVPPLIECLNDCLTNFEKFLHNKNLPVLIKAAIAHLQFETIHPFLDGNGRLGRLLITLLLVSDNLLDEPILYLSLYLKQNRETYYRLLQEVRTNGTWETWIEFFLTGIFESSKQAIKTADELNNLFVKDHKKIEPIGRARLTCLEILEFMKQLPQVTTPLLAKKLNTSPPTIRAALNRLEKIGILDEITGKKRGKVYRYTEYLDLLEQGAEPFG